MKKKVKKSKKNKRGRIVAWVGVLIFLVSGVVGLSVMGYFYISTEINPVLKSFYKTIPLPVVKVGDNVAVTSNQLFQDAESVRKFYETKDYAQSGKRIDFSTDDGKIRLRIKEADVLDKLIEDVIIQKIAEKKGIKISLQDIDKAVEKSLINADSSYEKLAINLNSNYGWTIEEFKSKVVAKQLYLKALFRWYEINLKNSSDYKTAQAAKNKILENGNNFDEMINKFSENDNIKQDGKISWIEEKNIIPEVAEGLALMKKGQISDVIISQLGMHIVLLEGRRESRDENGVIKKEVQLKQIFIRGKSFVDWIQEQKKQTKVEVLLKEYQWNANVGEVQFSSPYVRKSIDAIKVKSQGDPSLS